MRIVLWCEDRNGDATREQNFAEFYGESLKRRLTGQRK